MTSSDQWDLERVGCFVVLTFHAELQLPLCKCRLPATELALERWGVNCSTVSGLRSADPCCSRSPEVTNPDWPAESWAWALALVATSPVVLATVPPHPRPFPLHGMRTNTSPSQTFERLKWPCISKCLAMHSGWKREERIFRDRDHCFPWLCEMGLGRGQKNRRTCVFWGTNAGFISTLGESQEPGFCLGPYHFFIMIGLRNDWPRRVLRVWVSD